MKLTAEQIEEIERFENVYIDADGTQFNRNTNDLHAYGWAALPEEWVNESYLRLFNETAHRYYISHTAKSGEELKGYFHNDQYSWSDGLIGDEWEDTSECMACAEEKATQAIEQEME